MSKLPEKLPKYTITRTEDELFSITWEEVIGWFFIPKTGEKLSWAIYDQPGGERTEMYDTETIGRAVIHGIEGVEVIAREALPDGTHGTDRTFIAQLTDTHTRILAESHVSDGVKHIYTFLDGDDFLPNWGYGEDNIGNSIHPIGGKEGSGKNGCEVLPHKQTVTGQFSVSIGGRFYDTICIVDAESYNDGVLSETYLDANGRTVLWRRFNRDDWHIDRYGKPWSEILPENERLTANDVTYVHWYDCVTDYIDL